MNESDSRPAAAALRVLLIEDSERDAALLVREVARTGRALTWKRVETAAALREALAGETWDVIISDHGLPQFDAIRALEIVQEQGLDLPFLIVSGAIGEATAVEAMRAGAHDYIMKDNLTRLVPAIERELREAEVRRVRRRAEEAWREEMEVSAALARVGREMIASQEESVLVERLCRVTAEILGCESSHTFRYRDEEEVFTHAAGCAESPEHVEVMRVMRVPRAAVAALLSRLAEEEVVRLSAAETCEGKLPFLVGPSASGEALYTVLREGAEIIGVHCACHHAGRGRFGRRQSRVLAGIAQLASVALRNANLIRQLERASRLKSDFMATMSHELRTPLQIIIGYNALVLEESAHLLPPDKVQMLRKVQDNARHLLDLIGATLDLGRLDTGDVYIELRPLDVGAFLEGLREEAARNRGKVGVNLLFRAAPDLPALCTDALKLKIVLDNLIENAIKFTEQGTVSVEAVRKDGGVEFAVRDTGIGIDPQVQRVIFEPFRQGDSSMTRRYEGAGLGLYIVRRMLEVFGGRVQVESEVGRGSCFRVWLPTDPSPGPRV